MKRSILLLAAILLVAAGCSDFYSTLGGGGTGTTGSTGTEFSMTTSYPTNNQPIPNNPNFSFMFNRELYPDSVLVGSPVTLYDNTSGTWISGLAISLHPDKRGFYLTGMTLTPGHSYQLVLSTAIQDLNRKPLNNPVYINFTVSGSGTFHLTSSYPENNRNDLPLTPVLNFSFDSTLDTGTISASSFRIYNSTDGTDLTGWAISYSDPATSMNVTGVNLIQGKQYQIILTGDIKAINGASLNGQTINFQADSVPPGQITSFNATPGLGNISLSWNNPSDPDYKRVMIQVFKDGIYHMTYDVIAPNNNYVVPSLTGGFNYHFVLTTFDNNNNAGTPFTSAQTWLSP